MAEHYVGRWRKKVENKKDGFFFFNFKILLRDTNWYSEMTKHMKMGISPGKTAGVDTDTEQVCGDSSHRLYMN